MRRFAIAAAILFAVLLTSMRVDAAEDAKNIYLLGQKASMAGALPPPGKYGSSLKYYYSGDAGGSAAISKALGELGNISLEADVDIDVQLFFEAPVLLWITQHKILGGNLGLGALVPIGWQDASVDIDALATLTLANGTTLTKGGRLTLDDDTFNFGDPQLTALLGWHRGNLHWNVAGLLNVPIGAYDKNNIVNMGFNRWAFDATAAATWFNPQKGHEASVAAGFTFNGNNDDTNYETGTEFHVEAALMQHFSKAFAIGLTGYHYQQVTGDSGAGATLGSFKGRVTALGPNVTYNFALGKLPVATTLRWLHEFDTKNRLEGDAVFFMATIPLGGARQ
ncbi:MAG: SphA family protein [Alphaproteobacteria bacterium]